jgi:hypothetical protein
MISPPPLNSSPSSRLGSFARRVRVVRAWRGLAIGASAGAGLAAGWALLDWVGMLYTDWKPMGILFGAASLVGAAVGLSWPIPEAVLTRSLDRRAKLEDRLATANERRSAESAFDTALRADAEASLRDLKPNAVYPLRFGRWQGAAMALGLLAATIFLLGNSPILLSADRKKSQEAQKKEGEKVERVTRENFETPEAKREMSDAEKRLADELRKYQRDLEKARMSDEESLQRANDIAKQADELARQTAKESEQSLNSAQDALKKMQQDELAKAGLQNADPSMAAMPDDQFEQAKADANAQLEKAQKQADSLQSQLDALMNKLKNPKLTDAERKALEAQKKSLEKQLSDAKNTLAKAKDDLAAIKLSEQARAVLKRMMNDPVFKEIQELLKMAKKDAASGSGPARTQISDAERKEMQRKFDAMMKELSDPKKMEAYLQNILNALLAGARMGRCKNVGFCMSGLFPVPGTGAPGNAIMIHDIGKVNHSDKALPSEGKTYETQISGAVRPTAEQTPYVEIKAPATIGNRSSVPYTQVLPSYRRKAESALDRQQIPKEDENRVRAYFESLGH